MCDCACALGVQAQGAAAEEVAAAEEPLDELIDTCMVLLGDEGVGDAAVEAAVELTSEEEEEVAPDRVVRAKSMRIAEVALVAPVAEVTPKVTPRSSSSSGAV